jgi:hypothetical protein
MKHYGLAAAILCSLLSGCLPRRAEQGKEQPRLVPCKRARGKITIDGKLDEPAWQRAYLIEQFRVPGTLAKAERPSSTRLVWDDENLYLAMVMEDHDVYAMKKEHDSFTWEDDVCELFVKPSDVDHPYYEIHINPLGTTLDLRFGRRGAGHIDRWRPWESGIKVAVKVSGTVNDWKDKDKGWLVEAAIPLQAFAGTTPKPQLGDRWRFAICRYNYSVYLDEGKELTTSAPLTQVNFHYFEAYDILEFSE